MGSIEIIFKFLKALWPFVSEIFFAGRSVKQVVMENKLLMLSLIALGFSMTLNYATISKLFQVYEIRKEDGQEYVVKKPSTKASEVTGAPPIGKESPEDVQKRHDEMLQRLQHLNQERERNGRDQ